RRARAATCAGGGAARGRRDVRERVALARAVRFESEELVERLELVEPIDDVGGRASRYESPVDVLDGARLREDRRDRVDDQIEAALVELLRAEERRASPLDHVRDLRAGDA